jgi:hypothetical protein
VITLKVKKVKSLLFTLLFLTSCSTETAQSSIDSVKPIIQLNGDSILYLEIGEVYYELGATAYDDKDGNLDVQQIGIVDKSKVGQYKITYIAKDKTGNETTTVRIINVLDRTKPILSIIGESVIDIEIGEPFKDLGVSVIDNHDKDLKYTVEGEVNTEILGKYTLTYKAKDNSGNESEQISRTVNVVYHPAANVTPEEAFYFDKTTNTIDGYKREFGPTIIIPKAIYGHIVKNIASNAFNNNSTYFDDKDLISILVLPNSIKSIGERAFLSNKIEKLILPNSVDTLGYQSFWYNKITDLTLSRNISVIPNSSFGGNEINRLVIPEGVKIIQVGAFSSNPNLEYIEIPISVEVIERGAFWNNENIKEIKIDGDEFRFNDIWNDIPFPIELKKYK